jgi:predicted AAA+ superfamily ATPase
LDIDDLDSLIQRLGKYYAIREKNTNIYNDIRTIQEQLIISYMNDISKHSGKVNALHIDSVFNNIPMQLAQNIDDSVKRYKFKSVVSGKKGYTDLQGPIDWLLKAETIIKVKICNKAELPFKAFCKENIFKLYLFDVGILGAMLELSPSLIILGDYAITKGFFIENFVMAEIKSTSAKEIYSWSERNSEIEIIAENNANIVPIEVKSGLRTKAKSLQQFILKYSPKEAYVLSEKMFTSENQIKKNIPLYYAAHIVT